MSGCFAFGIFCVAWYEYKIFHCQQYSIGLVYFGLMELLQVFQHIWVATPQDNYAMCSNSMNQTLTELGGIHIAFQPYFLNYVLHGLFRRNNLRDRIESDLIQKIQFLGGLWMVCAASYWGQLGSPSTKECPNYNWMREGYDDELDFITPNIPGEPCTYISPTKNGHLAWVIPMYYSTYYSPTSSIHCFLMFFCHWALYKSRPIIGFITCCGFLSGPLLAKWLTPSVNEQGAVWCFHSVIQMILVVITYRKLGIANELPPNHIIHKGKQGEEPLIYIRSNKKDDNKMLLSSNLSDTEEEETTTTDDQDSDIIF